MAQFTISKFFCSVFIQLPIARRALCTTRSKQGSELKLPGGETRRGCRAVWQKASHQLRVSLLQHRYKAIFRFSSLHSSALLLASPRCAHGGESTGRELRRITGGDRRYTIKVRFYLFSLRTRSNSLFYTSCRSAAANSICSLCAYIGK